MSHVTAQELQQFAQHGLNASHLRVVKLDAAMMSSLQETAVVFLEEHLTEHQHWRDADASHRKQIATEIIGDCRTGARFGVLVEWSTQESFRRPFAIAISRWSTGKEQEEIKRAKEVLILGKHYPEYHGDLMKAEVADARSAIPFGPRVQLDYIGLSASFLEAYARGASDFLYTVGLRCCLLEIYNHYTAPTNCKWSIWTILHDPMASLLAKKASFVPMKTLPPVASGMWDNIVRSSPPTKVLCLTQDKLRFYLKQSGALKLEYGQAVLQVSTAKSNTAPVPHEEDGHYHPFAL